MPRRAQCPIPIRHRLSRGRADPPLAARKGASRRPGAVVAALALALLGCAEMRSVPDFSGGARRPGREAITVALVNDNYHDVVVYLDGESAGQRLGTVTGLCQQDLLIHSTLQSAQGRYQLRIHAIGTSDTQDYFTGTIFADPGDVIELNVASVLSLSYWSVRRGDTS